MARKKKQTELPGTERPTNEALDEAIGDWLDAREAAKRARDSTKDALATATDMMREVADQLEKDDNGNPCYTYHDGDSEIAVKLSSSSKLVSQVITDGVGEGEEDEEDEEGEIG